MGRRRTNNEDNFLLDGAFKPLNQANEDMECAIGSREAAVLAVLDGMGGQDGGERAAEIGAYGVSLFRDRLLSSEEGLTARVDACVEIVNRSVLRQGESMGCQMGSTLALAVLFGPRFNVYNLGDSRIYLWSGGELRQLSKDHTESQSLADMGIVVQGRGPAAKDGKLVQYLGIPPDEMILEPWHASGELSPGDRLLLCSDGLTDMLGDNDIASVLSDGGVPGAQARRLVLCAENAGGKDNITALVAAVQPGRLPQNDAPAEDGSGGDQR